MTVLFDHQAFEMQRFGGVSHSYAELIKHLKLDGCDCRIGIKESDNVHFQGEHIKPLHYIHNRFWKAKKIIPGQRTLTRAAFSILSIKNYALDINKDYCIKLLKRQNFDIFEPTFFDPYFLSYINGKPFVLTVHDMIPELFPQYFQRDDFQIINKNILCPRASAIHVPSQQTKEDLVNILKINPDKITVIPHGAPYIAVTQTEPTRLIDQPYILFVGERGGYKNFDLLLQELKIIVQSIPELNLLCTGRPFNDDEQKMLADLHLTDYVHHIFANDNNFYSLYHNAIAFVYPSAYEGFGIPILEAWSCECPVLLNNASCFPEVGGNAAIFFDINRRGELAEQLIYLYQAPKESRDNIISKGKERLKIFSWENSAKQLKRIYENIL